jgi:hypothetical protein
VLQVQAGAAGIGLHPEVWERERERAQSITPTEMSGSRFQGTVGLQLLPSEHYPISPLFNGSNALAMVFGKNYIIQILAT